MFTIKNKTKLQSALQALGMVIPKKSNMMILGNVKINANEGDDFITITATNLYTTAEVKVSADIQSSMTILAGHYDLLNSIKSLPKDNEVNFELVDDWLVIKANSHAVKLETKSADLYPEFVFTKKDFDTAVIHHFKEALDFVLPYRNMEFGYADICRVPYMQFKGDRLVMVATNCKIIGEVTLPIEKNLNCDFIASQVEGFLLLQKICGKEIIEIGLMDMMLMFSSGDFTIYITKKENCRYPQYDVGFRNYNPNSFSVERMVLVDVLNSVSRVAKDCDNQATFTISEETMSVTDNEKKIDIQVKISDKQGEVPSKICFNSKLLSKLLNTINKDMVTFKISSFDAPVYIEFENDFQSRVCIMPFRDKRDERT